MEFERHPKRKQKNKFGKKQMTFHKEYQLERKSCISDMIWSTTGQTLLTPKLICQNIISNQKISEIWQVKSVRFPTPSLPLRPSVFHDFFCKSFNTIGAKTDRKIIKPKKKKNPEENNYVWDFCVSEF